MANSAVVYDRPLDTAKREIRLLTILPSAAEFGLVSTSVETVSLTPDLEYIALSYVWGDSEATLPISVNDQTSRATVNLVAALLCFRNYDLLRGIPDGKPLCLWVDAICINQNDLAERAQQVTFMKDIYSSAKHVFTWLGPPDHRRIDLAIRTISEIISALRRDGYNLDDRAESDPDMDTSSEWETESDESCRCSEDTTFHDNAKLGRDSRSSRSDDIYNSDAGGQVFEDRIGNGEILEGNSVSSSRSRGPSPTLLESFRSEINHHPELCQKDSAHGLLLNTVWEALFAMHHSDYWERVWVYQEMALAKETPDCHFIFCGPSRVSMRDYTHFCRLGEEISSSDEAPSEMHQDVWVRLKTRLLRVLTVNVKQVSDVKRGKSSDFYHKWATGLRIANSCSATDPRDMIYALVAVLGVNLQPDYRKSVKQVYLDACLYAHGLFRDGWDRVYLREFLTDLLVNSGAARQTRAEEDDLPSWVPNLANLHQADYMFENSRFAPGTWGDRFATPLEKFQLSAEGIMRIHGFVCGSVDNVRLCPVNWTWQDSGTSYLITFSEWLNGMIQDHISQFGSKTWKPDCTPEQLFVYAAFRGVSPLDNKLTYTLWDGGDWLPFWRSLQSLITMPEEPGAPLSNYPPPAPARDTLTATDTIHAHISTKALGLDITSEASWSMGLEDVSRHIDLAFSPASIFRTTNGQIGAGPASLRTTDLLCIFNGLNFPVILRKVDGHWVYVGMCYVYGISYEEHSNIIGREKFEEQWFEIH